MTAAADTQSIWSVGRNCWQIGDAERVSMLVDAASYYDAFVRVAESAQRALYIASWDINGLIRLRPEKSNETLREFFLRLLNKNPNLHIYVLNWDFPLFFASGREVIRWFDGEWRRHERLHFHWDSYHAAAACHHQKIVVADDAIAFTGGLDLTAQRWDTPGHRPNDPRRKTVTEETYKPFHDVVMMVEGGVAKTLADLFRNRWQCAVGETLIAPPPLSANWPDSVPVHIQQARIGISRTQGQLEEEPLVREIHDLYVDAISAAKRWIYIENQYFTATAVIQRLAERLLEKECPEIVVVLPRGCEGWLEEISLGVRRSQLIHYLKAHDPYDRLHVYFPTIAGLKKEDYIKVHAKLMIVDNRHLQIGSANLCNRSMNLDSECDLSLSAETADTEKAIDYFRSRLLAEHLGSTTDVISKTLEQTGSIVQTIQRCGKPARTLVPFQGEVYDVLEKLDADTSFLDPEPPLEKKKLARLMMRHRPSNAGVKLLTWGGLLLLFMGSAAMWRWGPLHDWVHPDQIVSWSDAWANEPWSPFVMIGVYLVSALISFPISVLVLACALIFPFKTAMFVSLVGCHLSALLLFGIGRIVPLPFVQNVAGSLYRMGERLKQEKKGLGTVLVFRLVPVAPFSLINLVAGALRFTLFDFLVGTAIGLAPGIVLVSLLKESVMRMVHQPDWRHVWLLVLVLAIWGGRIISLRRFFKKNQFSSPA